MLVTQGAFLPVVSPMLRFKASIRLTTIGKRPCLSTLDSRRPSWHGPRQRWQARAERLSLASDPLSPAQLEALQQAVDRVQHSLNRLQTALDSWSEEIEEV